jgi:NADPH-dependent curcumin reductase CurA
MPTNRQFLIDHLPTGKLTPDVFRLSQGAMPAVGEGEVLVRTRYVSLDAANRAWMWGATYRSALKAGDVMAGGGVAEVVESKAPGFAPGDLVWGDTGWQDYVALNGKHVAKLGKAPAGQPVTYLLSVYGVAGLTAYFGLLECGQPKAGETVVVSAAAGSVGSLVGQIAKIKGCRVVGIAGGKTKCDLLTNELGFDAAVDYKAPEFSKAMRAAVPKGIDVYFDNVGGSVLEACLFNMNNQGRIACCGAVSQYDAPQAHGPRGVPGLIVTKRLTMRGFIVNDFEDQNAKALADLQGWVASGQLKVREDVIDGFENLPAALIGLLAGDNVGKRMVKVV